MMPSFSWKNLDAFSKPDDPDVMQVKTSTGAVVSLAGLLVMIWLSATEFSLYRSTELVNHLSVDTEQVNDQSFPFVLTMHLFAQKCESVRYYLRDTKGRVYDVEPGQIKMSAWVPPHLLQADPNYRPSREDAPGCAISTSISVPKVAGEFRLYAKDVPDGLPHMQMPGMGMLDMPKFNATHIIPSLRFGPVMPGQAFPLDGVVKVAEASLSFDYYLQLVPSEYVSLNGDVTSTHQFSVTEFDQPAGVHNNQLTPPGVTFKFDFSPIRVAVRETRRSFLQFVTSLCAIVGGVFAVTGMLNATLFRVVKLVAAPAPMRKQRGDE